MRLLSRIVPFLLVLAAALWASPVHADPPAATFEVTVVQASKEPGAIDPRVDRTKAPFRDSAYKSLQVVGQQTPTVKLGSSQTVPLAGDKTLAIAFKKHVKTGATVHLSIPGVVESTVTMLQNQKTVLASPKMASGNGMLVVQVKLTQVK